MIRPSLDSGDVVVQQLREAGLRVTVLRQRVPRRGAARAPAPEDHFGLVDREAMPVSRFEA